VHGLVYWRRRRAKNSPVAARATAIAAPKIYHGTLLAVPAEVCVGVGVKVGIGGGEYVTTGVAVGVGVGLTTVDDGGGASVGVSVGMCVGVGIGVRIPMGVVVGVVVKVGVPFIKLQPDVGVLQPLALPAQTRQ
jgi:hypothetical protein